MTRFVAMCLIAAGVYCVYTYTQRNAWKSPESAKQLIRSDVDYDSDFSNSLSANLPLKHLVLDGKERFR